MIGYVSMFELTHDPDDLTTFQPLPMGFSTRSNKTKKYDVKFRALHNDYIQSFRFVHPVVDNIIKYSNAYTKAYEKKISEIEQKIEKIKDKMQNNSSTTEMIDALFAPMMEEYEQAEGKDIFDLLDELEDD